MLHPPEKKEKDEQHSFLVSKKKEERRGRCIMLYKTTMDYILIYHLHLTHEMSI